MVKGQARVRIENRQFDLGADQGTYVPQGAIHRLGNPGDEVLEIVEVQTGSYLEEDDIVRLEDSFGRAVAGPRESGRVRPRLKVIPT
ncbi:MAG: cupin domain-containing protein [Hyphomicrobiaceae bacterium]|nr:cupin domain-containing protein [Hyphomicrobiaceae bacterium]